MKSRPLAALPVACALTMLAVTPALALPAEAPSRTINLPVELKDPYMAYSIGLVPFYSAAAATYVGTTRLSWDPPESLKTASTNQFLADLTLLAGGIVLLGLSGPTQNPGLALASLVSFVAIPFSHSTFYGPFWGDKAAEFNRSEMREAGFTAEAQALR